MLKRPTPIVIKPTSFPTSKEASKAPLNPFSAKKATLWFASVEIYIPIKPQIHERKPPKRKKKATTFPTRASKNKNTATFTKTRVLNCLMR